MQALDFDREELERRVHIVAEELARRKWADLAPRLPTGQTQIWRGTQTPYQAVRWDADWRSREGGDIRIVIHGYFDEGHEIPVVSKGEIIRSQSLWSRLLKRHGG